METSKKATTPSSDIDKCQLKPNEGCFSKYFHLDRWYFDPSSGDCKEFVITVGCGGNDYFETYEECSDSCLMNKKSSKLSAFLIYNSYY